MTTLVNPQFTQGVKKAKQLNKRFTAWRASAKYLVFLFSLETLTWTSAFYGDHITPRGRIDWSDLVVVITLFSGITAANPGKKTKVFSIFLAGLALAVAWAAELMGGLWLNILSDGCLSAFFGLVAGMILYDIWTTHTTHGVSADTIIGSVCVYILIGATWAFFYSLTELIIPNSFYFASTEIAGHTENLIHSRNYPLLMYYSFVTLCSLGYGDVLPVSPAARMLATGEAIVGQFYLAIFVARLISLYMPEKKKIKK